MCSSGRPRFILRKFATTLEQFSRARISLATHRTASWRTTDAAMSGGFTGISLGSTPTAIAAMTAVTKRYGPSPNAFVILPLVSALFVSLVNVAAITLFLSL